MSRQLRPSAGSALAETRMNPSFLRTSSTLTRNREPGVETLGFLRICALLMRAIRSPTGSFIGMRSSLPARLQQAGDQALGAELAGRDARQLVLAVDRARPPGDFATVAVADRRRITRQLCQLQGRSEALFHRLGLVHDDRLEPRAAAGILLCQLLSPVVLLDRNLLPPLP